MTCPMCGGNTKVISCASDVDIAVRKRECLECKHIFYTQEVDMDEEKGKTLINELLQERRRNNGHKA